MSLADSIGTKFSIHYASGKRLSVRLSGTERLEWTATAGLGVGSSGVETIVYVELSESIALVSWLEATGTSVSMALDWPGRRVWCFVTYDSSDGRKSYADHGTLHEG